MDSAWLTAIGEAEGLLALGARQAGNPLRDALIDATLQGLADHRYLESALVQLSGLPAEATILQACAEHRTRTAHLLRLLNIAVPGEQPTGGKDGQ